MKIEVKEKQIEFIEALEKSKEGKGFRLDLIKLGCPKDCLKRASNQKFVNWTGSEEEDYCYGLLFKEGCPLKK